MKTKKFDKAVVTGLLAKIESELAKKPANREDIALSLKANNIVKAINPSFSHDKLGAWNGYGYTRLGKHLQIANLSATKKALKKINVEEKKVKAPLTEEQRIEKWATRLSRLSGVSVEEAAKIASEKIDYKQEKINEMEERNYDRGYSSKRATLIRKMERENPLRPIKDREHALAILEASKRHNDTDYDLKLDMGRELADLGQLDREDVRAWARQNAL